jgi:hypothetical protein
MPGKYQELEASRRQAAALPTEDELSGLQKMLCILNSIELISNREMKEKIKLNFT